MPSTYTAFAGARRIAAGSLAEVTAIAADSYNAGAHHLLIIEDQSGRLVDLDLRPPQRVNEVAQQPAQGRGRPRLGVAAREVTLLPEHWEWLSHQRGGASATLRRLVDQARRSMPAQLEEARTAAYRVMLALAGDLPGYEDANRSLFSDDLPRLTRILEDWPSDVRDYAAAYVARLRDLLSMS